MNSVCMSKREASIEGFDESIGLTEWEKTVVRTAQKHGLTKRSDTDFKAKRPILRQELFIVASKLLEWAQET